MTRTALESNRSSWLPVVDADASRVVGGYRVVRMLATGGMGAVYLAYDMRSGEARALKVLLPELAADERFVSRFKREVQLAAKVSHRHLVRTAEPFEHEGMLVLPMEFLEGETLASYLARRGRLSAEETVRLLVPCCRAIHAVHLANVIHRDLKPLNIFLTRVGNETVPKVLDFGAARELTDTEHTQIGQVIGSRYYMAPEQAAGRRDLDARVDVYAMGAIAYQALSGQRPIETSYARLTDLVPTVPRALSEVVHAALAARESRIATADALASAMERAVSSSSPEATVLLEQSGVRPSERTPWNTNADGGDQATTLEEIEYVEIVEPLPTQAPALPRSLAVPHFHTPPAAVSVSPRRRWFRLALVGLVAAVGGGLGVARWLQPQSAAAVQRASEPEAVVVEEAAHVPTPRGGAPTEAVSSPPVPGAMPALESLPDQAESSVPTQRRADSGSARSEGQAASTGSSTDSSSHTSDRSPREPPAPRRAEGDASPERPAEASHRGRRAHRSARSVPPPPQPASPPSLPCGGNTFRPCID